MNVTSNTVDVGVLFIVFNRLETAKKVFDSIKKIKPPRLYIASDGPRFGKCEDAIVVAVRTYILENITWHCEIYTLFREKNLGCGPSVKDAIDWFFKHEEFGIILEDDVVPELSFFRYCEELLKRYKSDERIGMISGNNFIDDFSIVNSSYVFSKFKNTWGWATWKRAWKNIDLDMKWKKTNYKESIIRNMGYKEKSFLAWKHNLFLIQNNIVSSWDYQWSFTLASQNQLSIVPCVNLVSNIGFGVDATHTSNSAKKEYMNSKNIEFPLIHPKYVVCNIEYEQRYEKFMYKNYNYFWLFKFRLKRWINLIFSRFI